MYIQLKQGNTFVNPETGETHEQLTGGVTNVNIDTRNKRFNFLVKFNESRELIDKRPAFQQAFSIEDLLENAVLIKEDFTNFYTRSTGKMLGLEIEKAMYDFVLAQPEFENFEIVQ